MATDILVVEDNSILAMDLEAEAAKLGISVTITRDPAAAVEIARRVRPAVALIDVDLGGGFEGLDVARAVCAETPVVILTGHSPADLAGRMEGIARLPIYFKPLTPEDIILLLRDTLHLQNTVTERAG